jgi:hypothetical protein
MTQFLSAWFQLLKNDGIVPSFSFQFFWKPTDPLAQLSSNIYFFSISTYSQRLLPRILISIMEQDLDIPSQSLDKRRKLSNPPPLPTELELQILNTLLIPAQPCVPHTVAKCYDPWYCSTILNHSTPILIPSPNLLSVNKTWREEAFKTFFAKNTFVFNTSPYELPQPQPEGEEWSWKQLRDPHATRLLDFIDCPDWRNKGSRLWRHNFSYPHAEYIDRYRHSIRKLALIYHTHSDRATSAESDWDWVLKVDWKILPDLEVLYLDFQGTAELERWQNLPWAHLATVRCCAERMKCLNLKKLVLMNVNLDPPYSAGEEAEFNKEFGRLWRGALAPDGELVIQFDDSTDW